MIIDCNANRVMEDKLLQNDDDCERYPTCCFFSEADPDRSLQPFNYYLDVMGAANHS